MYSLLQKKPTVQTDPYPHIIIEEALPWNLYEELENTFPEEQVLHTIPFDSDICYRMKADQLLARAFHSKITESLLNLDENIGVKGWASKDIETDCQIVMHKPIAEKTTRTPHIDNPREMFAGLLYMPHKDDISTGGEFQLHTVKNDIKKVNKAGGREIYPEDLGPVHTTIPYKRNTFVMFCNINPNTVHGVSKRVNPTMYRRSVNIIAQFKQRFWTVEETGILYQRK